MKKTLLILIIVLVVFSASIYFAKAEDSSNGSFFKSILEQMQKLFAKISELASKIFGSNENQIDQGAEELSELQVISPNGGEVLEVGKSYPITWNAGSLNTSNAEFKIILINQDIVCIKYPCTPRETELIRLPNTSNSWSWNISKDTNLGNNYKIQITLVTSEPESKVLKEDMSDASFSITSNLSTEKPVSTKVIFPNGEEEYRVGDLFQMIWESSATLPKGAKWRVSLVKVIECFKAPCDNWEKVLIISDSSLLHSSIGTELTFQYDWTISSDTPASVSYRIKVELLRQDGSVMSEDMSDGSFNIIK